MAGMPVVGASERRRGGGREVIHRPCRCLLLSLLDLLDLLELLDLLTPFSPAGAAGTPKPLTGGCGPRIPGLQRGYGRQISRTKPACLVQTQCSRSRRSWGAGCQRCDRQGSVRHRVPGLRRVPVWQCYNRMGRVWRHETHRRTSKERRGSRADTAPRTGEEAGACPGSRKNGPWRVWSCEGRAPIGQRSVCTLVMWR